jgi:hypothetical protein
MKRLLSILVLITSALTAADYPIAKVITKTGGEYDETQRSWQGIPGIERASNGRTLGHLVYGRCW